MQSVLSWYRHHVEVACLFGPSCMSECSTPHVVFSFPVCDVKPQTVQESGCSQVYENQLRGVRILWSRKQHQRSMKFTQPLCHPPAHLAALWLRLENILGPLDQSVNEQFLFHGTDPHNGERIAIDLVGPWNALFICC